VLEELERVDWSRLEHAYGNANDVPGRRGAGTTREVVWALEQGRILEQAYTLLEDLLGASLRGWDER
jgi:hypothetical protein